MAPIAGTPTGNSRSPEPAKLDDDEADARRRPVRTQPESVLSGQTVEQVAAEADEDHGG